MSGLVGCRHVNTDVVEFCNIAFMIAIIASLEQSYIFLSSRKQAAVMQRMGAILSENAQRSGVCRFAEQHRAHCHV